MSTDTEAPASPPEFGVDWPATLRALAKKHGAGEVAVTCAAAALAFEQGAALRAPVQQAPVLLEEADDFALIEGEIALRKLNEHQYADRLCNLHHRFEEGWSVPQGAAASPAPG
jgi:hypothetical protein